VPKYKCPICGKAKKDEAWYALAGDNPGPNMLALGRVRHANTPMDVLLRHMPDDDGKPRCVTCLRLVPEARALPGGRIRAGGIYSGDESICCGQ
jgi:hypothetical protein